MVNTVKEKCNVRIKDKLTEYETIRNGRKDGKDNEDDKKRKEKREEEERLIKETVSRDFDLCFFHHSIHEIQKHFRVSMWGL
jgi:hypothetical protein